MLVVCKPMRTTYLYVQDWCVASSSLLTGANNESSFGSISLSIKPTGNVTAVKSRRLTMALYPENLLAREQDG